MISIHALREEGDARTRPGWPIFSKFLSTPSARRATSALIFGIDGIKFLSTPSARRATLAVCDIAPLFIISIHALREEGDGRCRAYYSRLRHFYPRPPRGGRHGGFAPDVVIVVISIHALREEGDDDFQIAVVVGNGFLSTPSARRATYSCSAPLSTIFDFYPRPPRGGRHPQVDARTATELFLSTPSARRATAKTEKNISAFVSL